MAAPSRLFLALVLLAVFPVELLAQVEVNNGWLDLVQVDTGWAIRNITELGDWNLPVRAGDVIVGIDGHDGSQLGPLAVAGLVAEAFQRAVPMTIRRGTETKSVQLYAGNEEAKQEAEAKQEDARKQYGIGTTLVESHGALTVGEVTPDGPAEKAGVIKGDEFLAIDGKDVNGLSPAAVSKLLLSSQPTPVRLRLRRGKQDVSVTVQRVSMAQVYGRMEKPQIHLQTRDETAPTFSLKNTDGRAITLLDFRGHWVLLHFWGMWCPPCFEQMPLLEKWTDQYRGKLDIIGIDVNDEPDKLHNFVARRKFPYPILLGGQLRQGVAAEYNIFAAPTNILIAPDGRVHYVEVGFAPNSELGEVIAGAVAAATNVHKSEVFAPSAGLMTGAVCGIEASTWSLKMFSEALSGFIHTDALPHSEPATAYLPQS